LTAQTPPRSVRGVSSKEFTKVPYIDHVPTDGRTVFLAPYVDKTDNRWKLQVPQGNELTWIFAEPVEACYYANSVADQSRDMYLEIMDVIARHYSFDSVLRTSLELLKRIMNCAVVLEKYFLWLNQFRKTKNLALANLVQTDLEFLFGNVRATYDLMQNILNELWIKTGRPKLKKSFATMVQMSLGDLRSKYGLPEPMIDYYSSSKDFFLRAREIRDHIYHYEPTRNGKIGSIVFCDVDGFALPRDNIFPDMMSSAFDIWPTNKVRPNGLVSVLALVSYVSKNALRATENFSRALLASVIPLKSLSLSYKVFLRSPYVPHVLRLDKYLDEQWIERELSYSLMS
jgi:hypothetical protein